MKNNFVAKFMNRFNRASVEQDNRQELLDKIEFLEAEIEAYKLKDKEEEKIFKRGDRVRVNDKAPYGVGRLLTVDRVEPNGKIIHTKESIYYKAEELDLI